MSIGPISGGSTSGTGSVTSVSVTTANGFSGTVAGATTTPAITIQTTQSGVLKGDGTAVTGGAVVNDLGAPTGNFNFGGYLITNLGTPSSASDVCTKSYADAIASGLLTRASCRLASTADVAGTYVGSPTFTLTNTVNGAITIDGVTPSVGDRILLKNQTTGTQNGIYTVTIVGDAGNPYKLTRATDYDSSAEILTGTYTFISSGTANAATGYILITPATITIDVTSLSYTQFSGAANYVAGTGLTLAALTFSVDTTVVATTTNTLTMSNKTLTSPALTGGTQGSVLYLGASAVISQDNSSLFYDATKKYLGIGTATPSANLNINQAAVSAGSPSAFVVTGGPHTTLTASTEAKDLFINLSRTVQFSTGALTNQRAVYITAPTYAFVAASTLSTAATLAVSSSPVAGTNATITRSYSLMSENGNVCFTMNSNTGLTVDFLGANTAATNRYVQFNGALSAAGASADFYFNSSTTRTAGQLFNVRNNTSDRFNIGFNGNIAITQSATSGGAQTLFTLTGGANTSQTASTEAIDVNINLARTVQFATGALATQRAVNIQSPTYGFVAASTLTTATLFNIGGAPSAGTNCTITNATALGVGAATTQVSANSLTYTAINVPAHTVTVTGATAVTSTRGFNGLALGQITVSAASAVAVTNASTLYIAGAPIAGGAGPASITNNYALWADAGVFRVDGSLVQGKGADVASAGDLNLGSDGNLFNITGTTQINAIGVKHWTSGSRFVLYFSGALTVKHNTAGGAGTAPLLLQGSVDLVTAANTVLELIYDGTNFQELGRKTA